MANVAISTRGALGVRAGAGEAGAGLDRAEARAEGAIGLAAWAGAAEATTRSVANRKDVRRIQSLR